MLRVLYTNVDQFLNKRDLSAQITGNHPPDIIIITEMLPNSIISSALFALPGYFLYLHFDPNNYNPVTSHIHGVGIFISKMLLAHQVFLTHPIYQISARIQLHGSDSMLVGCIHHSPTGHLNASVSSLCDLFTGLINYSHLLICGDFNFFWSELSGSTQPLIVM